MEIIIILILLVFSFLNYRGRKELEEKVRHIERFLQNHTAPSASPAKMPQKETLETLSTEEQNKPSQTEAWRQEQTRTTEKENHGFVDWLKEDWLMKLGALLLILGLAWFVSYAIAEGWIGPVGRIGLGLVAGVAVLALGRYRITSYVSQGGILMFVGALGIILSVWAGRELYGFFTQFSALFIMFLTSGLLGVTSVMLKRKELAYGNIFLAAVAPLLVASTTPSFLGLFGYLAVLTAGALWVVAVTGWRQLVLIAILIVFAYGLGFAGANTSDVQNWGLIVSYLFVGVFFFTSILGMKKASHTRVYDLITALLCGAMVFVWTSAMVDTEGWVSMLLTVWSLIFALGSFIAIRTGATIQFFFTYLGVGIAFLGIATAVLLDGPFLTIALILEATLLLYVGHHITKKASHISLLAIPSLVPLFLSFASIGAYAWRSSIVHSDAFVLYLLIGVTALLAHAFHKESQKTTDQHDRQLFVSARNISVYITIFYATVIAWLIPHALVGGDGGTMLALLVYTVVGVFFYVRGNQTDISWQKILARLYLALVVGHILLIDIWGMMLGMRVVTLLVIGSLLVFVAWVERSSLGKSHSNNNT